jgi:ABC-2 type transport system ATP-binding protein
MTTYTSAVEISHLRKTYGNLVAVDDVSLSVAEGEIFGILGPNGAGKTTAIECAIGLREPDAGTIRLLAARRSRIRCGGRSRPLRRSWC